MSGTDIGHQFLGQSKFHVASVAFARIPYPTSLFLQLFSVTIEVIMKLDKESVQKLQRQRETLIAQGIDGRYPFQNSMSPKLHHKMWKRRECLLFTPLVSSYPSHSHWILVQQ